MRILACLDVRSFRWAAARTHRSADLLDMSEDQRSCFAAKAYVPMPKPEVQTERTLSTRVTDSKTPNPLGPQILSDPETLDDPRVPDLDLR